MKRLAFLVGVIFLVACGSAFTDPSPSFLRSATRVDSLELRPALDSLKYGDEGLLAATCFNQYDDIVRCSGGVTWTVRDTLKVLPLLTKDTIGHVYPRDTGSTYIVASAGAGRGKDSTRVVVTTGPPAAIPPTTPPPAILASVVVTPATASIVAGHTQQFTAVARNTSNVVMPAVFVWAETGGAVDATGLYTAGSTAGTYLVIASSGGFADTATVTIPSITPPSGTGEIAAAADSFVNSIGVNVHLFYTGGVYGSLYPTLKTRLVELGVRHLRDHARKPSASGAAAQIAKVKELAAQGQKMLWIMDERFCTPIADCLTMVKSAAPGSEAMEGPNEPDLRGVAVSSTKTYMTSLYAAAKGDPGTSAFPMLSPSFLKGTTPALLGDVTAIVDGGSIHPYPQWPHYPTYVNVYTQHKTRFTPDYGSAGPWWVTEAGYHTATPPSDRPVTEAEHAKFMPRMLLEYFNSGAARTYIYEMLDQGPPNTAREDHFGLVRYDGSPKPGFTAIKNLIALTTDTGATFTPGKLDYALSGSTTNVDHTLLQKRDGRFYLVLWLEIQGTGSTTSQTVTVTFATSVAGVNVYRPSAGMAVTKTGSGTSITLQVPDDPIVLEVTP